MNKTIGILSVFIISISVYGKFVYTYLHSFYLCLTKVIKLIIGTLAKTHHLKNFDNAITTTAYSGHINTDQKLIVNNSKIKKPAKACKNYVKFNENDSHSIRSKEFLSSIFGPDVVSRLSDAFDLFVNVLADISLLNNLFL